jgi:Transglycosylase SLT domain
MSRYNSPSSSRYNDYDPPMERYSDFTPVFPPIAAPSSGVLIENSPTTEQLSFPSRELTTEQLQPLSGQLHDVATTQSLIVALQSTMAPNVARTPVVIPGAKKRRKQTTEELAEARRMSLRLRHGIVLGAIVAVMITTLVSLAPLKGGQTSVPLFAGAADWVQAQQQGMDVSAHTFVTLAQANTKQGNAPVAPVAPVAPATNPVLPPLTLSTSAYVAIARQDAVANGINPDYFVRQIQIESGFNPNAASPAGAVGIAQFEPATAAALGVNPWNPQSSLAGAARYMANFAKQYNGDYAKALAAYNAGSGTVQYAVAAGGANWMNFLPGETQQYIAKIMGI